MEREYWPKFVWLGIFAHPDDETSASAGTMIKLTQEQNQVYVITATGGELGSLGTAEIPIKRTDLPKVREEELRANLKMYGVNPPFMLRYIDQDLETEDLDVLSSKLLDIMQAVEPDIIVTFGPSGISRHPDHIAIHKATVLAYRKYKAEGHSKESPLLIYPSIPNHIEKMYDLCLSVVEKNMDIVIDIQTTIASKITGLRNYKSQQDAQDLASDLSEIHEHVETYAVSPESTNKWETLKIVSYLKSL